jgi:hypothetical protein
VRRFNDDRSFRRSIRVYNLKRPHLDNAISRSSSKKRRGDDELARAKR